MNSGEVQLQARDQKILDHIARYRITLRPVLDHVFFHTESSGSGNVLQRLLKGGYITARDGLPGKRRYYQLTAKGAAGRVSIERTKPIRAQALRSHIAILWFCTMGEARRLRLETWELRDLLKEHAPEGRHCAVPGSPLRLFRVQVPGTRTRPPAVISALKDNIQESHRNPLLKLWMKDSLYGFAILAEAERAAELRSAAAQHKLHRYAPILVESVPSPQTLARAIHDHRISQASK
jgi:hypothetical protein